MKRLLPLLLCLALLSGCAVTYDGPTEMKSVLTEMESYYFDETGSTQTYGQTEFAYDIYGNVAQRLEYLDDEPVSKSVTRYDEAGRIIQQSDYDLDGWFPRRISTSTYTYDGQGRLTSSVHDDGTVTYAYDDEAGTQTTTLSNGAYTVQYLDENGWTIRSESVSASGQTTAEEFDRREDGQLLTIRYYENGVLETVTEYTYDDQGRVLTCTETENGETHTVFWYEYGDGFQRLHFEDGSHISTGYNADGTIASRMEISRDDIMTSHTIYRYSEIRVPAGEVEP